MSEIIRRFNQKCRAEEEDRARKTQPSVNGLPAPAAESFAERHPHWTAVLDGTESGHPHRMRFNELMAYEFPPLTWLVSDLVSGIGLTILGGPKKQGKSWMALDIAVAIATGGTVLGKQAIKGEVVFWVLEDGLALVQDRLRKMLPGMPAEGLPADRDGAARDGAALAITFDELLPPLNTDDGMETICRDLAQKPAAVLVDTLAAAKSGKIDENDAAAMGQMMNNLRRASMHYAVPIVFVAHQGKATSGDAGFALRGSSAIAGASHVNLSLVKGGWLIGEGKQIEKFRWGVRWNKEAWHWERTYQGDATGEEAEQIPEAARPAPARGKAEEWIINYLRNNTDTDKLKKTAVLQASKSSGIDRSAYYRGLNNLMSEATVIENPHSGTLELGED